MSTTSMVAYQGLELHKITFANISITAKDKELLDFSDILKIALKSNFGPRKTVSASYQFIDVSCEQLGGDITSLSYYGRIVKDTTIVREQVIENGKLVPKRVVLPSSPSAFFVFNLADHRMALMAETQGAPSVSTYGNTLKFYMIKAYEAEVRRRFAEHTKNNDPRTLKSIRDSFPRPQIDIIPIADKLAIATFLKEFEKINQVVIKVTRRNQDLRHGELFDDLAEEVAPLGPSSSKFVISGGNDGLNKEKTTEFVKDVVDHGYEDTTVTGEDRTGAKIKGSNEDYSLIRSIKEVPSNNRARAEAIHQEYVAAKSSGQIRMAQRSGHKILEQLEKIKIQNE